MAYKQNDVLKEFDRLNNLINEFYHEIAMNQGLSDSAYSILQAILILGNGCTQTDIYKYACLNKQTVNSSVKRLQQDGILELKPGNGREVQVHLTPDGEKFVKEKILPIEQAESEVFDEMTSNEKKEILRLVGKYLQSFREKITILMEDDKRGDG